MPTGCGSPLYLPNFKEQTVDERAILGHLEALAESLGVEVRYEGMEGEAAFTSGGLCRVKDRYFIILNKAAAAGDKIQTLASALKRFDLSGVYLKPALRELIEQVPEKGG